MNYDLKRAPCNRLRCTRRVRCFLFMGLFAAVLLAVSNFAHDAAAAAPALSPIIVEVSGNVEVKRPASREWSRLSTGQWLARQASTGQWLATTADSDGLAVDPDMLIVPEGSRIRTKIGSRAVIQTPHGASIVLHENSFFEIITSRDGNFDFKLWLGDARSKVPSLQAGRRFSVRSGVAVASVRGTDFLVSTEKSGRTQLSVYEGRVAFRSLSTGASVTVAASQNAAVDPAGALGAVERGVKVIHGDYSPPAGVEPDGKEDASKGGDGEESSRDVDSVAPQLFITAVSPVANGIRVSGITEPGARVSVNGYPLSLRTDGSFDQVVTGMTAGEVTFEASDEAGNVTRSVKSPKGMLDVAPPVLTSASSLPGVVSEGDRVTVTLGISDASPLLSPVLINFAGPSGHVITALLSHSGGSLTGQATVPLGAASGAYSAQEIEISDILGNSARVRPNLSLFVTNGPPPAPSAINVTDERSGGVATLSWAPVSAVDFQNYIVYQGASASGPWTAIGFGTRPGHRADNLIDGTRYYFCVFTRDIGGNLSSPSEVVSVVTSDQIAPDVPSGLVAVVMGEEVALSWNAVPEASSYGIYRSGSASGGPPWIRVGSAVGTTFIVGGLSPSTTYHFSVSASDNNIAPPGGRPNESAVGRVAVSAAMP